MIKIGDILEFKNHQSYLVVDGNSYDGVKGELTLVEIDENNNHLGEPFQYQLSISSSIIDIIR